MEFHISRVARDRYEFDHALFALNGNVVFANFHAVRIFTQKLNRRRDLVQFPEKTIRAGQVNAMGLIDEILHYVVGLYRQQHNPQVMVEALDWLEESLGAEVVDRTLRDFSDQFPPVTVYRREISIENYMAGETGGIPNRAAALEEMVLLWLANTNPAFSPFLELFDDAELEKESAYLQVIQKVREYFNQQPHFGPENQNLIEMLRSPALAIPHSLSGQLDYIREKWGYLLGGLLFKLLSSLDLISEEEKAIFLGSGRSVVYDFSGQEVEPERFSPDSDWMPRVVLLAKNAYVWLDQLSKKYQRKISSLNQIPDEELDQLRQWGFTGLWLIGLWERSKASQRIKQLCGNPDAVASAYSLEDYRIAEALGGEQAYENLSGRAWERGIRLSSDMVPNHMGIDSRWVIQHPDWFIGLDYSPFPSYSFNGPDLSPDGGVGLFLEDHYYDRSDAAVVFKRVNHNTGEQKFIYHGNDGTSMPWNDTAQLDFLNPAVREAVVQTILHVARKFPIIRFDAAMTLAKRHYQRLWFPEPGSGGAIPSRAEHGMTKMEFDRRIPLEFWREVVDRVAQEVPDTLLLAEAFWLMEGYFVRTLGMHRVYNSAFMNMLRDEENANYRSVMKNTLEFDPEILKRFVNFMNNPDERTAVEQFGSGDKYFGICTLLATLPGLPMFGHGQIEGYAEKYGMEFYRAYWDEKPDSHLVERHQREIFPLLHRRRVFAEAANFLLYDFYTPEGFVNEDVFAYSNGTSTERGLVVYHNKYADTRGWIRTSVAYAKKDGAGGALTLVQKPLAEGLGLLNQPGTFTIFREYPTGLEYLRENQALWSEGLFVDLGAYENHVYLDFRQVQDNEWRQYAQLCAYLDGRGVPDIEAAAKELLLRPVHHPFRELVNPGMFRWLISARENPELWPEVKVQTSQKVTNLLEEAARFSQSAAEIPELTEGQLRKLQALLELEDSPPAVKDHEEETQASEAERRASDTSQEESDWGVLLGWLFIHQLGRVAALEDSQHISRAWIDEWLLGKILDTALRELGAEPRLAWDGVSLVKLLTTHHNWHNGEAGGEEMSLNERLRHWLRDPDVQAYLQLNRYQGILWFNREAFERMARYLFLVAAVNLRASRGLSEQDKTNRIATFFEAIERLLKAADQSGYQVDRLLNEVAD